ncbi:MAG: type IV secretion system protein, partial [Rickettsiales bacterium]|nr:type IV secretion system protein [Rickettsiales bacterium]
LRFVFMVMMVTLFAAPVFASATPPDPAAAPAGGGAAGADNNETSIEYASNEAGSKSACPKFSSVIMTVTYCVQKSVVSATELYLEPISDLMLPITMATLVLVVAFFGYRLSVGETELNRKTFTLLIKIGVVLLFGYNFGGWTRPTFSSMISLQDAVVTTLWNTPDCPISDFTAGAPSEDYISVGGANVWATMDCIVGKLFGFGGSFIIATSIFGMLGSLIGSGTMGVMVFFFGLSTLLTIFFFALRTVYIFLVSYILVGFLITISPMVMPMILFRTTQNLFDAWLKNLMGALLTPGVIFTYLCLAIPLLDYAIMSDDSESGSLKSVVSDSEIQNAYRNQQQRCSLSTQNTDFSFYQQMAGSINIQSWVQGPFRNVLVPSNSAATDGCQFMRTTSMDFGANHVTKLTDIGMSLVRIFLIGQLVTMMMTLLPELVAGWIGGGQASARAASAQLPGQQQLGSAMNSMRSRMSRGGGAGGGGGGAMGGFSSLLGRR